MLTTDLLLIRKVLSVKKQKRKPATRVYLRSPSLPERGKHPYPLIKDTFVYISKKENIGMKKEPHLPCCTAHKGKVFYSPVMTFLK